MKKIIFTFLALTLMVGSNVWSNNLALSGLDTTATDTSSNHMSFSFDLSQDNSWRSTINSDAVWVFMKYSTDAGVTWQHASMAGNGENPAGFSVPSNFEIIVPQDEKGFFLQRTDFGSGSISAQSVTFVWDYGQDGLTDAQAQAANTIHKLFGVEMVSVPTGAFYAGDGFSSSDYRFKQGSSDDDPWYVSSESSITTTNSAGDGNYYTSSGASAESASGSVFLVPNSYPKGYSGFYAMKYELTEGQWVGFFNTLSASQKLNRDITSSNNGGKGSDLTVNRNTVSWDSSNPNTEATTTRPARAMSYISWPDVAAYADWAGLRPMTELEFEKLARGIDISPIANEYAWGSTSFDSALSSELISTSLDEDGTEFITDGSRNVNRNAGAWTSGDGRVGGVAQGQEGPLRVGIFAHNSDNRITSGSGYYGSMELSGNLSEPAVTLGNSQGRQFLGTHGDGNLTTLSSYEGNATNVDWPGINSSNASRGVTSTSGIGYRGGDYDSSNSRDLQISTRSYAVKDADSEGWAQRFDASAGISYGGRLVRTAP